MIFKQIDEILSGTKTQTRRVVKPSELIYRHGSQNSDGTWAIHTVSALTNSPEKYEYSGRVKWEVGRDYAVASKRGQRTVLWKGAPDDFDWVVPRSEQHAREYMQDGYQPLRIRITAIRQERLQDITEDDAKAEGVADVEAYRALWQAINGKTPGARWDANPQVFVLEFEVVK